MRVGYTTIHNNPPPTFHTPQVKIVSVATSLIYTRLPLGVSCSLHAGIPPQGHKSLKESYT
jgi:hypothetical protein